MIHTGKKRQDSLRKHVTARTDKILKFEKKFMNSEELVNTETEVFHEPLVHIKSETVSKNLWADKSTPSKDDFFPDVNHKTDVYVFRIKEEPLV